MVVAHLTQEQFTEQKQPEVAVLLLGQLGLQLQTRVRFALELQSPKLETMVVVQPKIGQFMEQKQLEVVAFLLGHHGLQQQTQVQFV